MKAVKIISLVLCLCLILCGLTACTPKKPQTAGSFKRIMKQAGFEVQDVTDTANLNGCAKTATFAVCDNYQIEFYETADRETAIKAFEDFTASFEDVGIKTMSFEMTMKNYNYINFTTEGIFYVIVRVDNTLLFSEAKKEYRTEILNHVKTLGYK